MNNQSPTRILIVDNHPLFLESIDNILSSSEYEVRKAGGGLEAIDILDTFKPQIFFIDLVMPYIGGDKLSRYIRAHEEFAHSFIVILSGIAKESETVEIPPQADAFIAKGPLKNMAGHIFDVIDQYKMKKRNKHPEALLGLKEIAPRHITKELLFSVKHLEVLLDNMREGVIEVSTDNRIVFVNPAATEILGINEFDMLSRNLNDAFAGESAVHIKRIMEAFDRGDKIRDEILKVNNHYVRTSIHKVKDSEVESKIVFFNDVTSFKEKEASLHKALGEKEMLLREVHHRVKNNLNVISGLISIQSSMIGDESVRKSMLEIQPRLQTISLVHEKLYNTDDLTNIDLRVYLEELASLLLEMMVEGNEYSVDLSVDIPSFALETNKTVSIGLICTELITNAVKYGFHKDNPEPNRLSLSLKIDEGVKFLSIANNGHPFPEDLDIKSSRKLGFQVINLLVEQLEGSIVLEKEKKTKFTVIFP